MLPTPRYEGSDLCAAFANSVLDWCDEMTEAHGFTERGHAKYKRLATAVASGDIEDAIAAAIELDDFEEHELQDGFSGSWLVSVEELFEVRRSGEMVA